MSWNNAYWNAMSNIFWTLDYVGLKKVEVEKAQGYPDRFMVWKAEQLRALRCCDLKLLPFAAAAARMRTWPECTNNNSRIRR